MVCLVAHTTIDARDAYEQSVWWAGFLGYTEDPDDPNEPGHEECLIRSPDGSHAILFLMVPEAKSLKNRLHFDLRPRERSRDEEVEWALSVGATQVDDQRRPDGTGWVVLADPEGNEFCILRSAAELAAS